MFDTLFSLTIYGAPLMALVGLGCLVFCRGECRRYLAWSAGVCGGSLALLVGGCMGPFEVAWRAVPSILLCIAFLASGALGVLFTLGCVMPAAERPRIPAPLWYGMKGAVLLLAGLILTVGLWMGGILILFVHNSDDRVVEYQGQKLVEVNDGFLDPHYCYYAYHGPLFRGREQVWEGPTHIWGDYGGR